MADIEKVIKGLDCCLGGNDCDIERNEDCPYKDLPICATFLHSDVIELLKTYSGILNEEPFQCKDCEYYGNKYKCPCYETKYPILNFSCADGVRKNRKWLSD